MRDVLLKWIVALGVLAFSFSADPVTRTLSTAHAHSGKDKSLADREYRPKRAPADTGIIFQQSFDDSPAGLVDEELLDALFDEPRWSGGVEQERVSIVTCPDNAVGRCLEVLYPRGGVGPGEGGAQWQLDFSSPHDELYLSYRLRFAEDFDFVLGGKLPGFAGGEANTGGSRPDGSDGWSARMMWRQGGQVVQYVYHPDQESKFGEDMAWDHGSPGQRYFQPGAWHSVEHRVVMNTPGERDGLIEGWFDGRLAFRREGLRFRDVDHFAIDVLLFSTFFGGRGEEWAPTKDERIRFDEFVISTKPISR